MFIYLYYHFFDHFFHLFNFGRNLDYIMLHFSMLENALGAKHGPVILTIELYFFRRMNVTEFYGTGLLTLGIYTTFLRRRILNTHWQCSQHGVVYWQVLRQNTVTNFVVRTLYYLMLVQLSDAIRTEGMATREWHWFFIIMVVCFEADSAFKNLV